MNLEIVHVCKNLTAYMIRGSVRYVMSIVPVDHFYGSHVIYVELAYFIICWLENPETRTIRFCHQYLMNSLYVWGPHNDNIARHVNCQKIMVDGK